MSDEHEILQELGNQLLRSYCPEVIYDITCVSKRTLFDSLLFNISEKWKIPLELLPSEERLYRVFRYGKNTSAVKEKMALLLYAATEVNLSTKVNKSYLDIANRQQIQSLPNWNRFVKEYEIARKNKPSESTPFVAEEILQRLSDREKLQLLEALQIERKQLGYDSAFLSRLEELERAFKFDEADKLLEELQNKDEESLAWKFIQRGWYRKVQGQYHQAIEFYTKAVSIYKNNADFYHHLGNAQSALDLLDDAINSQLQALAINVSKYPENHYQLGVSYNNLFLAWFNKGDYKKAEEYILKTKRIFERSLNPQNEDFIILYHNLGMIAGMLDKKKEAIKYTRKAAEMAEKLLGFFHEETAKAFHNLGQTLIQVHQYDEAISWLEKALQSEMQVFGPDHHTVAQTFNSLGTLWYNKGEYSSALFCLRTSLGITRKTYPYFHNETGLRYNNIGKTLIKLIRFREAEESINTALEIYSKTLPDNHHKFGICYFNLANLHFEEGNYDKAVLCCNKAKGNFVLHFDKTHFRVVDVNKLLNECSKIK
jgi:tetratricopeptide (TPR) repeat protein